MLQLCSELSHYAPNMQVQFQLNAQLENLITLMNVKRKHPDRLADSCKCSSIKQMAAGSSHGFFFFHLLFKHALCS